MDATVQPELIFLLPLLALVALWGFVYRPIANAWRSTDNVKRIMVAMHNHHDSFRSLPNGYPIGKQKGEFVKPSERFSWRVQLLPYLDHQELFDQFRFDEPWDSEHNLKVASDMPDIFRSRWDARGTTDAGYLHVDDLQAAFPTAGPINSSNDRYSRDSLESISDGPGDTVGIIEVADSGVHWAQPSDLTFAEAVALLQKGKVPSPGTAHIRSKAALVGMMDGSVRNVPIGIPPTSSAALLTRQGGELVDRSALGWNPSSGR
jgi:hypothetical protein